MRFNIPWEVDCGEIGYEQLDVTIEKDEFGYHVIRTTLFGQDVCLSKRETEKIEEEMNQPIGDLDAYKSSSLYEKKVEGM